MFNLPNELRDFYRSTERTIPRWRGVEVLPPKTFKPNIKDYFKRSFSWNYEYIEDGCNWDVIFDYGISRIRLFGKRPFCTPVNNRIVNRYAKEVPLVPISIPELDEDLDPNALWLNLTWRKESYVDGARDITTSKTGEAWKFDEIDIELIRVKRNVYFENFFTGAEITVKVTYKSRKNEWNDGILTADTRYSGYLLHSINEEWIHTYKVWDKYYLNNEGYINKRDWGEFQLFAPHRADDPIIRVYLSHPKWLIDDRWGENATSQYRVQLRSFFSDEFVEYDAEGTRDNRKIVPVVTPVRNYQITRYTDNPLLDFFGIYYRATWTQYKYRSDSYEVLAFQKDYEPSKLPPPPPPLPDPEKEDEEKMDCCEELKGLLALILKRIGALPASVPNSLVRSGSGVRQIESIAEYIAYSVIQTNAQIGAFPQEIKIQDSDLTQEGDQEKKIKLPNIAESIAEMVGILLTLQAESNANLIATINGMIEAGSARQAAIIAGDYAAANAEFLGYKGKQIDKKIWFSFTPGEGRLAQMLQPREVSVPTWENGDDRDLNDVIAPLLELAAMYRAKNYRNVGTADTLAKLKSILTGGANLSDALDTLINNPPPPPDPAAPPYEIKKSTWDEFIEQAETGFIAKPGITDNLHPYGRELERRPRIREFGSDTSEEENAEQ